MLYLIIYADIQDTQDTFTLDIPYGSQLPGNEYYEVIDTDSRGAIIIELLKDANYEITNSKKGIGLIVTKSCTIIFNTYWTNNEYTPLIINENWKVSL